MVEVFADWFSAEALAVFKSDIKNFRVDLCTDKKLNLGSSYLTNKNRINKVYLAQPKLKKLYFPINKVQYCTL